MKKIIILVSALIGNIAFAQNVGINTTGANPVNSAALDIDMSDKGLLIPRVPLTAKNVFAPVTGTPTVSLLVYNTQTAGTAPNDVTPGYYYWDGAQWLRLADANAGGAADDWKLLGNAGTDPNVNFVGTTDDNDLILRRNSIRAGRLGTTSTSLGTNALNPANNNANNTAVGVNSAQLNTGSANTSVGVNSLNSGSGSNNIAVGIESMNERTGDNGVAIGYQSSIGTNDNKKGNYSVAIGYQAGNFNTGYINFNTVNNVIAIGRNSMNAGISLNGSLANTTSKIAIGEEAFYGGTAGNGMLIGIGRQVMKNYNATGSNLGIGDRILTGTSATQGQLNLGIGEGIMQNCSNCEGNTAIGFETQAFLTTGHSNTTLGRYSGYGLTTGYRNTVLGYRAGMDLYQGYDNVVVGNEALPNSVGYENVVIGSGAGQYIDLYGCVYIGFQAGLNTTLPPGSWEENKLKIDNSSVLDPLIYGEFDNNILRANGTLQVSIPGSGGYAFPAADGTVGQVMVTNGAGTVSWQNAAVAANAWTLNGNAGTNPSNNFLGTTDAQDLVFRTNNVERARIDQNGYVGVNSVPAVGGVLTWDSRVVVNETDLGLVNAIWGSADGTGSAGVQGTATAQYGYGLWGENTGGGDAIVGISNSSVHPQRHGVVGISEGASFPNIFGYDIGGTFVGKIGAGAWSIGAANTERYGGAFYYASTGFTPASTAQLAGYNATLGMYYGGYFAGGLDYSGTFNGGNAGTHANSVDYAYVGTRIGATNYKIVGNGSVSTIIDGEEDEKHIMFAPEAPEILFQDYGVGQLVNGEAKIAIDPILAKNIFVDESHPLKVFVQLKGDCNGVYVTAESAEGFTVKELQGGTSNVSFSYQIVANRADRTDKSGNVLSKHVDVRLPEAPEALGLPEIEVKTPRKRP